MTFAEESITHFYSTYLILDAKHYVVGIEKVRVLLLELLPHQAGEARLHPRLGAQR